MSDAFNNKRTKYGELQSKMILMRITSILLLSCLLLISCTSFYSSSRKRSSQLDAACGNLIRANLTDITELKSHVAGSPYRGFESELINLAAQVKQFNYAEKREFLLLTLLYCDVQGGAAVILFRSVEPDGVRLSEELSAIPNSVLTERLGQSVDSVQHFRNNLNVLKIVSHERVGNNGTR